ncbi:MAG: DUF255 domain-containing protein [Planctomycetes bacterium]|nr:DUF255 domain-containing protein [Planctomycetota bacterium]MCP4861824.1 DUF255 domain-containing protein [Planctomycetota bacterium]
MSAFLLCAALFLPQFGAGSDGSAEITAGFAVESVGAGSVIELQVAMEISAGWHAYHPDQDPENGIPVSAEISGEGWEAAGEFLSLQAAQPHTLEVGTFKAEYLWISGKPTFSMPVRVPTALGATELSVEVHYQLCDDAHCLAPMSKTFSVPITITDAAATDFTASASGAAGQAGDAEATLMQAQEGIIGAQILADGLGAGSVADLEITLDIEEDWHEYHPDQDPDAEGGIKDDSAHGTQLPEEFWPFILMAITAGAATLLTPCVFPMIPVTISYFTKRSEAGKGTPVGNATAYAGGIIFTFAGIGGGAALLLGPTGANQIGSNPYVNTAIGLLFIAMAVSLLGYYEIQAPRFLQKFAANAQSEGQSKGGYLPVAIMAIAFSITAFTCTVAFVGAVFAAGLKLGPVYLFGGMFVYGLVFALPFFFLALFPSKLQSMPNAGGWMNTVKVCAGFIEIIAAVKFFSNADLFWDLEFLTWPIVFGFSALVMIIWAAYMFGLFKMPHDYEKPKPGKARYVFAAAILLGGIYLIPGTFNRDYTYPNVIYAFAPPPTYGLPGDIGPAGLTWFENYEESFEHAREEGLPLFVDFTGVTCPNCRAMENGVFPDDSVKPLLKQFARVELWVDKVPEYADMEVERFSQASQPFYVLLDPRDDSVLGTFPGYDPDASKFAEFLQAGLDMYQTNSKPGPN